MAKSIKDLMRPGDVHVIIDRSEKTAAAFDHTGERLFKIPALARGQHDNWREKGGNTPPGRYRCGVIYDTRHPDKDRRAYGDHCIDLIDEENQETGNGRAGVSWHSGGTACPDPFADYQPLLPTLGCTRSHNKDMREIVVPLVRKVQARGNTVYVTVQE